MPQFIFQKYIDKDYEEKQQYLSEISDRVLKIATDSIKSDEEFISQSILQAKSYAQLIIELFDYIESNKTRENTLRDDNEKLTSIISPSFKRAKSKPDLLSARGSITEALTKGDSRYLEQKIEYLNGQISKNRKLIDAKTFEFENLQIEKENLLDKIELLNKNNAQLKEENQKRITELKKALQSAEDETKELLDINFELKDKYKALEAELYRKKKEVSDLKERVDPEYVEKLENEIQQLREQNEFSEKLEDIEKLKEIINEKDNQYAQLQKQLESKPNIMQNMNLFTKLRDSAKLINRIVQKINEPMQKQDTEEKLKEIPEDSLSKDEDVDFLVNRINSKLIDVSDCLCIIYENLPLRKINSKNNVAHRSPEKVQANTDGTFLGLFSKVLESAQLLRDQIEEDIDRQILIDQSGALFQELLILFHGLKQIGTVAPKKMGEISHDISNINQSIWIGSDTRSPSKILRRNTLVKIQEEISGKLKHSLEALQVSNTNDVTQQLQLQMDRYNDLSDKYEAIKKVFHSASLVINEEAIRCLLSVEDVLSITSDNVLILRLKRDLSNFKTQIENFFAKKGHLNNSQKDHDELHSEFERQRAIWETNLKKQKDCFAEEIKKLEDALHKEEKAHKKEKETSAQIIVKLENDVKLLGLERDQLTTEFEHLRIVLKDEKFSSEEAHKRNQHDLQLERQLNNSLQVQVQELQKFIVEREKTLLQSSSTNTELQTRCTELELEVLKISRECEYLQKDNKSLTEQISLNQMNLKELSKRAEKLEEQTSMLEKERERLANELLEKERNYDTNQEQIAATLETAQREYHGYIEKTQAANVELKQGYETLISEYLKKLEQQKIGYETSKQEIEAELKAKKDEIRELNFKYQTLKDLSLAQESILKKKDEKLNALIEESKLLQEKALSLDFLAREATNTQEKSKKYFDLLTNRNTELENMKSELEALTQEKKEIERRAEAFEFENKRLKEEVGQLKDSITKINKRLNDSLNESKALREKIETEQQNLIRKEKELKFLNESSVKQSSATINFKDELIQRLQDDVKSLTSEYENLRVKYQRLTEINEQMATEIQDLRTISKEKEISFKEMEELDRYNNNLLEEVKRMRSELKKKDKGLSNTKKKLKYDIHTSQKKLRDISNRQYFEESPSFNQTQRFLANKAKFQSSSR